MTTLLIASRFKKRKGRNQYNAKVGGGVGKRNAGKGGTKGGVGIAKENVHWYLMGTSQRITNTGGGEYRGAMPGHKAVSLGFAKSSGRAMANMRKKIRDEITKEVRKLKK